MDQLCSELIRLSVKKFRIENFCFNISIQVPQIPPTVSEWERGVGMMANEWLIRFRGNINKKRKRIQERLINRYLEALEYGSHAIFVLYQAWLR